MNDSTAQDSGIRKAEVIKLSGGSGYGYSGWKPGQTIRNERFRVELGEPEYLTVLEAGSQYIRDEGRAYGVGAESGYYFWANCRAATKAERVRTFGSKRGIDDTEESGISTSKACA